MVPCRASSVSNTFTVPPSGTVTMRIAHANSYGRLRIVCVNVRVFFLRVRVAELRAWMRNVCVCVCVCVCVLCVLRVLRVLRLLRVLRACVCSWIVYTRKSRRRSRYTETRRTNNNNFILGK